MWPLRWCIKADHDSASRRCLFTKCWLCSAVVSYGMVCSGLVSYGSVGYGMVSWYGFVWYGCTLHCATVHVVVSPPYVDKRQISPQLCSSPPAIGACTETPVLLYNKSASLVLWGTQIWANDKRVLYLAPLGNDISPQQNCCIWNGPSWKKRMFYEGF